MQDNSHQLGNECRPNMVGMGKQRYVLGVARVGDPRIQIQIQIKSYSALSYRGGRECITLSKCQMKQMSLESAAESRMVIDGA